MVTFTPYLERKDYVGHKNKKCHKDLHQQAYDKLNSMQAFGESKKQAIKDGTDREKIFSFKTYQVYWEHTKYFLRYVKERYPECRSLKKARPYAKEWLQFRAAQGLSPWTIHTEAAALRKLFGIAKDDPDYFTPPKRERKNITRSRVARARDKHFSKTNNDFLIRFCKAIGARREGLTKMKGKDLRTRGQIQAEINRLVGLAKKRSLTEEDQGFLQICKDALLFEKSEYFVYLKEKGGRERISPIVGPDVEEIVARFRETAPDEKVWQHVNSNADIHGYRSDYANRVYKAYARPIEDIPYDKVNKGTGIRYQSEVYHCRKDEKGKALDRRAMLMASKALGHNRIDVVANNYLRGL